MSRSSHSWGIVVFALITSLLYAIVGSAQVLGFLKVYFLWLVIPFVLVILTLIFWLLIRQMEDFNNHLFPETNKRSLLDTWLWVGGIALTICLIVYPLVFWPYSHIQTSMEWDVGVYHFPKAIELMKTGSAWDFSIAYGEYPFGSESLFSFAALLTRSTLLFGTIQALQAVYLLLVFWLLIRRYSILSGGIAFILANIFLISGLVTIKYNFWSFYRFMIYTVGMNDLFLTASVLAVIFFAPIGPNSNKGMLNLPGMAVNTMLAVSTKPNAILVLLPVWAWTLFYLWTQRENKRRLTIKWRVTIILGFIILPGLLWIFRNLIGQNRLFSPEVLQLQRLSILNNLFNPWFYLHIPRNLIALIVLFIVALLLTLWQKRMNWSLMGMYAVLFLAFFYTPASGFVGITTEPTKIVWRFAGAVVLFATANLIAWIAPGLNYLIGFLSSKRVPASILSMVVMFACIYTIWWDRDYLAVDKAHGIMIRDQFLTPVGIRGYNSVYDFVQKNVADSVVWVENGLPFFVYGPRFTNSVSRQSAPDVYVFLHTTWWYEEIDYPSMLNDPAWLKDWNLVYEDTEGRVYQRSK
jgi:hypothetical protein